MKAMSSGWAAWARHCLPASALVGGLGGFLVGRWGWSTAWWWAALVTIVGAALAAVPVIRFRSRREGPERGVAVVGRSMGLRLLVVGVGAVALVLAGFDRLAVGVSMASNYVALLGVETWWVLRILGAPPSMASAAGERQDRG